MILDFKQQIQQIYLEYDFEFMEHRVPNKYPACLLINSTGYIDGIKL